MPAVAAGTWVQIENTVLEPAERAPQIPEETRRTPLVMRTKGFLKQNADPDDEVTVETVTGRTLRGKLIAVNPPYEHGFGAPIPELFSVGRKFRELIRDPQDR